MIRTAIRMMLVTLVTAFALTTVAEAAPKKHVRHRTKHSSRVSTGGAPATATRADTAPTGSAKAKRPTTKRASSAKKATTAKSAKRRPTTKPR
jgi:hypothetical protein